MNKYLISGIPKSIGGAGKFLDFLIKLNEENSYHYQVLYPIHNILKLNNIFGKIINKIWRISKIGQILFIYKINNIKDAEIILLHPQSMGYKNFLTLVDNNKVIKWYILDNGFFCIESYNYNRETKSECLNCLGNIKPKLYCIPMPKGKYEKNEIVQYLVEVMKYSKKITFFAQNINQEILLKKHFGNSINVKIIGLQTNEYEDHEIKNNRRIKDLIVYHGSLSHAKGIEYVINLASNMRNYSFLIPYSKEQVKEIYNIEKSNNLVFERMDWEHGLKKYIINANIVLCPSLWSAPIEGALIKSLYYNGNVAVMSTEYGFHKEIPVDYIISLTGNISTDTGLIEYNYFKSKLKRNLTQEWIKDYISKNKIYMLFL